MNSHTSVLSFSASKLEELTREGVYQVTKYMAMSRCSTLKRGDLIKAITCTHTDDEIINAITQVVKSMEAHEKRAIKKRVKSTITTITIITTSNVCHSSNHSIDYSIIKTLCLEPQFEIRYEDPNWNPTNDFHAILPKSEIIAYMSDREAYNLGKIWVQNYENMYDLTNIIYYLDTAKKRNRFVPINHFYEIKRGKIAIGLKQIEEYNKEFYPDSNTGVYPYMPQAWIRRVS
jgi:hypothetical protein